MNLRSSPDIWFPHRLNKAQDFCKGVNRTARKSDLHTDITEFVYIKTSTCACSQHHFCHHTSHRHTIAEVTELRPEQSFDLRVCVFGVSEQNRPIAVSQYPHGDVHTQSIHTLAYQGGGNLCNALNIHLRYAYIKIHLCGSSF